MKNNNIDQLSTQSNSTQSNSTQSNSIYPNSTQFNISNKIRVDH